MPESSGLRGTAPRDLPARPVDAAEARRIAVRSQLLDGTATDVLATVHRLGFLQLDPIATVAPAQHVVLWSRLGSYDVAELDRLCWETRSLFEWDAFLWPNEQLPLVRGFMRRWRSSTHYKAERWVRDFLAENRAFRRYVLRELDAEGPAALAGARGPLGGREGGAPVVRLEERRAHAHVAPPPGRGRGRRAGRRAAALGPLGARAPARPRRCRRARPSGSIGSIDSARSAFGSGRTAGRRTPTPSTATCPTGSPSSPPSTG